MKKVRFIHVGVGGFGRNWVNRLKEENNAEVVALVDVNEGALNAALEEGGYNRDICYPTLADALKNVEADALVCVTPPVYHREVVVEAMENGLDVISEKPMADSIEDCITIMKTAHSTGRKCVISQNYRYKPGPWTMARLVEKGKIGPIGQMQIDFYLGRYFEGFRQTMPYPLIIDMAIHHFDLIRYISGLNPVSVRGVSWNPPWSSFEGDSSASLVFEMENGARVVYNGSWSAKGQFSDWEANWHIEGEKGAVLYEKGGLALVSAPNRYDVDNVKTVDLKNPPKLDQAYVLDNFITSMRKEKRPQTDVFDNIYSVSMVFAAVEAVRTGNTIPILTKEAETLLNQL